MAKARTAVQIVADIRTFQPAGGNWRQLDDLLSELWATESAGRYIPDLLSVLERFPEDDGDGVLWSIVHGIESLPGYELELVRSVRHRSSELGVTMIGRLLNGGMFEVDDESLVNLLQEVASSAAPESVRANAAHWAQRHVKRDASADVVGK